MKKCGVHPALDAAAEGLHVARQGKAKEPGFPLFGKVPTSAEWLPSQGIAFPEKPMVSAGTFLESAGPPVP